MPHLIPTEYLTFHRTSHPLLTLKPSNPSPPASCKACNRSLLLDTARPYTRSVSKNSHSLWSKSIDKGVLPLPSLRFFACVPTVWSFRVSYFWSHSRTYFRSIAKWFAALEMFESFCQSHSTTRVLKQMV